MVLLLVSVLLISGFVLQLIGFTPVANASSVLANFSFRLFGVEIIKSKYFYGYQLLGLIMMVRKFSLFFDCKVFCLNPCSLFLRFMLWLDLELI